LQHFHEGLRLAASEMLVLLINTEEDES
jgi:hypothetical protein